MGLAPKRGNEEHSLEEYKARRIGLRNADVLKWEVFLGGK
jgi:hypothetical protein